MKIETKFSIGQDVCLFNGLTLQVEHDEVFGILVAPGAKEGAELDVTKPVSEMLASGAVEVAPQYQLQRHQGLISEDILFSDEKELKAYYLQFFSE